MSMHAGVLADAGEHLADRRLLRDLAELLEVHLRALVGAVLAPHHRVHRQLGAGRAAAEDLADPLVLVGLQPEVGPGLLALGILGGGGDGVESRGRGSLARQQSTGGSDAGQRSSPSAMTSSIGRTASSPRSAWSATVATPPTRREIWSASTSSRSALLGPQSLDHPVAGGPQHLALGPDRGVRVVHRGGDLGRPALVQADQPDVLVEPGHQQVARASPRRRAPSRRPARPSRPRPA